MIVGKIANFASFYFIILKSLKIEHTLMKDQSIKTLDKNTSVPTEFESFEVSKVFGKYEIFIFLKNLSLLKLPKIIRVSKYAQTVF